jgi:hypothetical protein
MDCFPADCPKPPDNGSRAALLDHNLAEHQHQQQVQQQQQQQQRQQVLQHASLPGHCPDRQVALMAGLHQGSSPMDFGTLRSMHVVDSPRPGTLRPPPQSAVTATLDRCLRQQSTHVNQQQNNHCLMGCELNYYSAETCDYLIFLIFLGLFAALIPRE